MAAITNKGGRRLLTWITTLAFGMALPVVFAVPAAAKPVFVPPNFSINNYAAGELCEFAVRTESGGGVFVERESIDKDGNAVYALRGVHNTFEITNRENGRTFTLQGKGFSYKAITTPDGTVTIYGSGHILYYLLPTDVPAGPSWFLFLGRVVTTEVGDPVVATVQETNGRTIDLCALVS
jgi:hypothetical protein